MRSIITIFIASLSLAAFAQHADEPKQLTGLRESYTKARIAATAPIDKKYVEALTAMKLQLTKSGDLKGALAVDAEITQISALSTPAKSGIGGTKTTVTVRRLSDFSTAEAFAGWLATTRWTKGTDVYTFENGQMTQATPEKTVSRPLTVLEVGKVTWEWTPGLTATLTVNQRLDSAEHQANGKTPYVLTRDERKK